MPLVRSRRGLAALTFTFLFTLACSGEVLAPPDGVDCTRGKLGTGAPKFGEISEESCLLFNDWDYEDARAESWTLDAKANSAYVIRLVPVDASGSNTDWDGDLSAYSRNAAGDAAFAAVWRSYVDSDYRTREMVLVTDRDREISIRVSSYEDYFGGYRLEVERCPTHTLRDGGAVADLVVNGGCLVSDFNGGGMAEVAFVTYRMPTERNPNITIARTAGTGQFRSQVGGPDLDIFGDLGSGVFQWSPASAGPVQFDPEIPFAGMYTIAIGVTPGTAATVRVSTDSPSLAALQP